MEIKNPKRVLVLSTPESGPLEVLKQLTGSAPTQVDDSIAGLTHSWTLKTQYYTTDLTIWLDDISDLPTWSTSFSSTEAKEVLQAIGAILYIFRQPVTPTDLETIKATIGAVKDVLVTQCGECADCTCIALGTRQSTTTNLKLDAENEEWDDFVQGKGWEYIDAEATGRNAYSERVGIERLREALETTEWEGDDDADLGDEFEGLDDFGEEDELGWAGLDGEQAEMNMELFGLKSALRASEEEDEEQQVEEMGRMMGRLMAIKDTTSGMPEEERKKFAAKAVKDFMKDV